MLSAPQWAHVSCLACVVPRSTLRLQPCCVLLLASLQGACTPEDIEKKFTNAHYQEIVQFKTADYSFYLPVASALLLSGVTDEAILDKSRAICRRMGEYFQVQDDYLDCYGDPAVTGKVGTDIVEQVPHAASIRLVVPYGNPCTHPGRFGFFFSGSQRYAPVLPCV